MLKSVTLSSSLLYHILLLGFKKILTQPPTPRSVFLGRYCTGTSGGDTELSGTCAGLSPLHPSSPYLSQNPMGGQGNPDGHSSLTYLFNEEGYDQQAYFLCNPGVSKGNLRLGVPMQSFSWKKPLDQLQGSRKFFSAFSSWKRNQWGKGSPILLPLCQVSHLVDRRGNPSLVRFWGHVWSTPHLGFQMEVWKTFKCAKLTSKSSW